MPWYYADGTQVPPEDLPEQAQTNPQAARGAAQPSLAARGLDVAVETALGPFYEARYGPGRRVQGAREGLGTLATGLAAYPAGLAAGAGQYMVGHMTGRPPAESWREAGKARRAAEEALTYAPRTEEGARAVESVAGPLEYLGAGAEAVGQAAGRGLTRAGYPAAGDVAEEVLGFGLHPLNLLGLPEVRGLPRAARTAARGAAERAALQSLGAPAKVGAMTERRGLAGAREVGRELLELPGARLAQGPAGVRGEGPRGRGGPLAQALEPAGEQLGALRAAADATGQAFDLGSVLSKFDAGTGWLAQDPLAGPRLAQVRDYVAKTALGRGLWTPEGRQLMHLQPSEAHNMRRGLDAAIYSAQTGLPRGSPVTQEMGRLRTLVDRELQSTMDRAGVGHEWARANRHFENLKEAERIAKAGYAAQKGREGAPTTRQRMFIAGLRMPGISLSQSQRPGFTLPAMKARSLQWLGGPVPRTQLPLPPPAAPLSF